MAQITALCTIQWNKLRYVVESLIMYSLKIQKNISNSYFRLRDEVNDYCYPVVYCILLGLATVQNFKTGIPTYKNFLLSLLVGSIYCRFLNFHNLGTSDVRGAPVFNFQSVTSDVLFLYASSTVKMRHPHCRKRWKTHNLTQEIVFTVLDTCSQQIYDNFR